MRTITSNVYNRLDNEPKVSLLHIFYRLFRSLITFANTLEPDQIRQNVGPDLGSMMIFLEDLCENVSLGKISGR